MGMTMSQKIFAAPAGLSEVKAGQLIEADLDLVLGDDITSPVAIIEMKNIDKQDVYKRQVLQTVTTENSKFKNVILELYVRFRL